MSSPAFDYIDISDNEKTVHLLEKAGPREKIFFDPVNTHVGIITCGTLHIHSQIYMRAHFHVMVLSAT